MSVLPALCARSWGTGGNELRSGFVYRRINAILTSVEFEGAASP
jgi:hypothetical protein